MLAGLGIAALQYAGQRLDLLALPVAVVGAVALVAGAVALQVLEALVKSGRRASELLHLFDPVPQLLKNVRFEGGIGDPLEQPRVKQAIAAAEAEPS